jgi:hypothetical protein
LADTAGLDPAPVSSFSAEFLKQFHHIPAYFDDNAEGDGAERMHCEFAS